MLISRNSRRIAAEAGEPVRTGFLVEPGEPELA
jgi:hypothetical protein